jgi:hypothetical protein
VSLAITARGALWFYLHPYYDRRDKKLESWVKDLGGAGRGEPTIVTPKQCEGQGVDVVCRFSLTTVL